MKTIQDRLDFIKQFIPSWSVYLDQYNRVFIGPKRNNYDDVP